MQPDAPVSWPKRFLSWLKYPVALALLYWVLQQADLSRIDDYIAQLPWHLLLLAVACFTLAQYFSVLRMNRYYAHAGRPIDFIYACKLHYVGLFYNIILPGGIGGDGYKIYLLKKNAGYPAREGIKIQVMTRLNGLLVLCFSMVATLPFLHLPVDAAVMVPLALVMAASGIAIYFRLATTLFKSSAAIEWRALPYSFGVQGFNLLCMVCLWWGLADGAYLADYILLFQLAALAGMIPITIGGLGIREATFFYGAIWLNQLTGSGLNPELGVTISLLVFGLTALSACIGLVWIGKLPKMNPCEAR